MSAAASSERLTGVCFAKQFPNPAEPLRGVFVGEQIRATCADVDWRIIAPVPWAPSWLARALGKPYVRGDGRFDGIPVARPRYPVMPKRLLYATVAPAMARSSRAAFEEALTEGATFVHAHALYPSAAAARRLAATAGVPLIVSVHGSDLYTNLERPSWAAEVRAALRSASAIVCVSPSLARDVVALAGADPLRVTVIPNTYDATRFAFGERSPVAGRSTRFVSVGRLVPVKGHDVLLRAFGMAVRAGLDANLEIIGDGPERGRLEAIAAEQGPDGRVQFSGALADDALISALGRADAFVLPSRREGFGVALVEALATGLPALATRSGGPDDIVGSGDGLLVPPEDEAALADGLAALARSLDEYDRPAIAARAAERFSPASVAWRLVSVYHAVLVGEPVPGAVGRG
jgi:glycosyltransferase involved in cell wall biosynthesis